MILLNLWLIYKLLSLLNDPDIKYTEIENLYIYFHKYLIYYTTDTRRRLIRLRPPPPPYSIYSHRSLTTDNIDYYLCPQITYKLYKGSCFKNFLLRPEHIECKQTLFYLFYKSYSRSLFTILLLYSVLISSSTSDLYIQTFKSRTYLRISGLETYSVPMQVDPLLIFIFYLT